MGSVGSALGAVAAPFTGGASLLPGLLGGGGGGVSNFLFGQPPRVVSPFAEQDQPFQQFAQGQIGSLFGGPRENSAFGANPFETSAGSGFQNFDPMSFFSGAFGSSGGNNPFSLLSKASGAVGTDTTGAGDLLKKTIGGGFTDPTQNPFYSALSGSATDAAQRFLNQNLDTITSGMAKAGGGVANPSAVPETKSRATENVASQLGGTLADIQSKIYGQERGFQDRALSEGLQLPFETSSALASIAGAGGNLANIFGGLDLSKLTSEAGLGGVLQNRSAQGFEFPFEEMLKYLAAIQGAKLPQSTSPFASLAEGIGSLGQGLGAVGARV